MNEKRDVIGELIAEDNARPIHPAVAEYAVSVLHTAPSDGVRVAELELLNVGLWRQNEEQARVIAQRDARIEELEAHCARLGQGGAERYWENRWRETDAELARKTGRLEQMEPHYLSVIEYVNTAGFAKWGESCHKTLINDHRRLAALKAQPSGVVPAEFIEHVKHARKELCRLEQSPLRIRQRLAQKLTDYIDRLNASPVSAVGQVQPSNSELMDLARECAAMPGGSGMLYANYGREVLRREGERYVYATTERELVAFRAGAAWQARAALTAGSAVPDGWRLVPEHPTDVMVQSVIDSGHYSTPATAWQILVDEYRAMLAAAPSPGQPAGKKAPSLVECDRCPTSGGCLDVCMRAAPTAKKEG